ncbi:hypothetical protein [Parasediminibacterium sp. JCM 36343]|uniref:hypothetical protein n=1 Tax=Parasediminibacterium sp. JCM 36343 TaxID=3374279 RepID=UPI003979D00A
MLAKHCFYIILGLMCWQCRLAAQQIVQLPGGVYVQSKNLRSMIDESSVLYPGQDISKKIKNSIFIKVFTSQKSCFVGEPLLVTYKLFTRLNSQSKVVDPPTFTSCSVVEMTTNEPSEREEYLNGIAYKSYIIRKVQLFPLQDGLLQLGVATVDNDLLFYEKDGVSYRIITKKIKLVNEPLSVQVNPLPTDTQQHLFTGVVGNFFMNVKVKKPIDSANDNNALELTITGKGNFMNLVCPTINWPLNIQAYESQATEKLDKLSFPVLGEKKFIIPFSCKQTGDAVIPPIQFCYFDAATKKYSTVQTDSIHITVNPAAPIIDTSKLSGDITNTKYIWIVPAIALAAGLGLFYFFAPKKKRNVEEKVLAAKETGIKPLITIDYASHLSALLLIENEKGFFKEGKVLASILLQDGQYETYKTDLTNVIVYCNQALYAPLATDRAVVVTVLRKVIG